MNCVFVTLKAEEEDEDDDDDGHLISFPPYSKTM